MLCADLGFDTAPDQAILRRTWNHQFTPDLQETVQTAARTILIKASQAGVSVPREPDTSQSLRDTDDEPDFDDQTVLGRAEEITEQVSRTVYRLTADTFQTYRKQFDEYMQDEFTHPYFEHRVSRREAIHSQAILLRRAITREMDE